MKKDYLIPLLLFLVLGSILISLWNNARVRNKLENISQDKGFARNITFIESEGPIILEILSPIFYFEGGYFSTGVKKWTTIIENARKNPKITGLILRINSPGGSVGASQELYESLKRFRESGKPIVTSVIDICASGAYYAALPSNYIIANYGSLIGSIGVRITAPDFTELYKKLGIGFNEIKSGEFKDILSSSRKIKTQEKKHLQSLVNFSYEVFLNDVLKWRGKDAQQKNKIKKAANGLIYNTKDSLLIGLIDGQGDLVTAKKKMAELLDIPYEKFKIKKPSENIFRNLSQELPLFQFLNKFLNKNKSFLEYSY